MSNAAEKTTSDQGKSVSDNASWIIIDVDKSGRVSYVNTQAESLAVLQPNAFKGQKLFTLCDKLFVSSYREEAQRLLMQVFRGERNRCEFFAEVKHPEGKQVFHFLVQAELAHSDTNRMVVVFTDITVHRMYSEKLFEAKRRSMRLVEYGNLIIVRTDPKLRITDILGDAEKILGISAENLVMRGGVWTEFIDAQDLRRLREKIKAMGKHPHELSAEIRIRNQGSGEGRWILLHAVPLFTSAGAFLGWEGFGLDITEKRRTEVELRQERRRVEALYEVSKTLQVQMDPAFVALRGLSALIRATGSVGGLVVFSSPESDYLEIVAAQGLSQDYIDGVAKVMSGKNLMRYVIEHKKGLLIDNIQKDSRAAVKLAIKEGIRSCVVMPLMFEERGAGLRVVGSLLLCGKKSSRFSVHDFDLVAAASSQIALVLRQAEFYMAERRQASSLAALYRLSHQLSKLFTPEEVAQNAFPIIQEEIACKRMWMGVINQQGTHLQGVGGIGPGVRQPIIDIQIELGLRHDFLDQALEKKQAVIVEEGQEMECSGLTRLLDRLKPKMFVIVPLVSLGQVIGVIMVEPAVPSAQFLRRKLPLLSGMANEIATVLLARRLESKVSDAEKMRMAGLLASGVAHNFNNLLQAVMGQASLIEMQVPPGSPLGKAASTIIEAAGKGAGLIKHLLSFTQAENVSKRAFSVTEMLKNSRDLYLSVLGKGIKFELNLEQGVPEIYGDYGQIQQVVTNLIQNAKEALQDSDKPKVSITTRAVRLQSGEVDRELAPGLYLRIDVEDNGVGMSHERRVRCFEPFYTSKNADSDTGIGFSGSGLGLSIGYSIVKQHNGLLMVQSQPGSHTVFSIYLPAQTTGLEDQQDHKVIEKLPSSRGLAMVLDPESVINSSVTATLDSLDFEVELVDEIDHALKLCKSKGDLVKLVIIDIDSKLFEGSNVVGSIVKSLKSARILLASSNIRKWEPVFKGISNVEVLEKPLGVWAVHSAMRKVMYKESLASDVVVSSDPNGVAAVDQRTTEEKQEQGEKSSVH